MEKIIGSKKAKDVAEKMMKETVGTDAEELASQVGINLHDKVSEDKIGEAFDKFGEMLAKKEKIGGKSAMDIVKEQNNKYGREINDVFKGMSQGDMQRLGRQLKKGGIGNLQDELMKRGRSMQRGGDRNIKKEAFNKVQEVKKKEKQLMGVFINKSRNLKPYKYYPSTAKEEAEVKMNSFNISSISPYFLRVGEFKDEILTVYYTMDKKCNKVLSKLSGNDLGGTGCIILEGKDLTVEQVNKLLKIVDTTSEKVTEKPAETPVPAETSISKVERNKKKRAKKLEKKKNQKNDQKEEKNESILPGNVKDEDISKMMSKMMDNVISPSITKMEGIKHGDDFDISSLSDIFESVMGGIIGAVKDIKENVQTDSQDNEDIDIINAIGEGDPEGDVTSFREESQEFCINLSVNLFSQPKTKGFKFTKEEQERIVLEYNNSTDDSDKGKYADSLIYGLSESRLKEFNDFISKQELTRDYQEIINIIDKKKSHDDKDNDFIDQI